MSAYDGPVWAYAGKRADDRNSITGARRHAVTLFAHLSGLAQPDAECGELGYVLVGEWNPADPLNCLHCSMALAFGVPDLPDDYEEQEFAARQPLAVVPSGPAEQLELFPIAA